MKPFLRCTISLLLVSLVCFGIDISTLKPQGYVSDFAYVVDYQNKADLESYCARVEKATGVQMAFVTLKTIDGEPIEDFANDLYRRWGIGQKGKDEGLLLLLVVGEKRSRLEVGRGLEPVITDGTSGTLLREMRASLRENRYGEALWIASQSLGQRVAQEKGVQIPDLTPRAVPRTRQQPGGTDLPWPLLLGGALLLFWVMSMGGRRGGGGRGGGMGGLLPGLILGNVLGRSSYGGHGGGGFGGYDSGDSFGGFGGGDSGGGGASSDW